MTIKATCEMATSALTTLADMIMEKAVKQGSDKGQTLELIKAAHDLRELGNRLQKVGENA